MSTAKSVVGVEPKQADWMTIDDTDGKVYRYLRTDKVNTAGRAHVRGEYSG